MSDRPSTPSHRRPTGLAVLGPGDDSKRRACCRRQQVARARGLSVGEYIRRLIDADLARSRVQVTHFPFGRNAIRTGRRRGSTDHDRSGGRVPSVRRHECLHRPRGGRLRQSCEGRSGRRGDRIRTVPGGVSRSPRRTPGQPASPTATGPSQATPSRSASVATTTSSLFPTFCTTSARTPASPSWVAFTRRSRPTA